MKKQTALTILLIISIMGLLFSGYLSYGELIVDECYSDALGMGECAVVQGLPACVYGFIMYLCVFIISIIGLKSKE